MRERCSADPTTEATALDRWRNRTDAPLLALAVGTVPLLLLEFIRADMGYWDRIFLDLVNVVVLAAFAVDYIVELALARDRRSHARRELTSLTIVIAQCIALLPQLTGFGALRAARAARTIRGLAALGRGLAIGGASARQGRTVLRRHALGYALGTAGLTFVCAAVAFALAEGVGEQYAVPSIFDAFWWAGATMTGVGTGDIAPVTFVGRVSGLLLGVVGISTFAVLTAKIAEFLVRGSRLAHEPESE